MSELPPGVELVEIDDKEYDWTPCPKCGLARWWYTAATKRRPEVRMCFQCNPPPGNANAATRSGSAAYHRRRQAEGKSSKPRGKPYKARRSAEEITEEKRLAKVFGLSVWQYRKANAEI